MPGKDKEKEDDRALVYGQQMQAKKELPKDNALFAGGSFDLSSNENDQRLALDQFSSRFGLAAAKRKNKDLLNAITKPEEAIENINKAYDAIAANLLTEYREVYGMLVNVLNLSEADAKLKADEYMLPIIQSRVKLLKLQFPYSFGKGSGKGKKALRKGLNLNRRSGEG